MPCGGAAYGDSNLVFIANDWHTALLPVYLQVSDTATMGSCQPQVSTCCAVVGSWLHGLLPV